MRPLKIAALAMGAVGFTLLAFLAIGFILPSSWEVERTAWIDAPPSDVFIHLGSAEAWEGWTPSPDTGVELFGPDEGEGSGRRWDDPGYGRGEFVIVAADPPRQLGYAVEVEGGSIEIVGTMSLEPDDGGTRVHWVEEGDFGRNPLLGYLAGRMEGVQGGQLEASLRSLRRLVEEGRTIDEGPG